MSKKGKKKSKKKNGSLIRTLVFLVILGVGIFFGKDYLDKMDSSKKPDSGSTPTPGTENKPKEIKLGGATVYCYGDIWSDIESEDERIASARKLVEEKYDCHLKRADISEGDEDDFDMFNPVLTIKDSIEKGKCVADIVCLDSMYFYPAVYSDLLIDLSVCKNDIPVSKVYMDAATYKRHINGISFDCLGDGYVIVYDKEYIGSLGLEQPSALFKAGKWSYDDFEKYLQKMSSKLPEGVYPIGMEPYEWLSMAACANGSTLLDNELNVGLCDEAVVETALFYQKLESMEYAFPMMASYDDDGNIISLIMSEGYEDDRTVMKVVRVSDLLDMDTGKLGVVFWPWGSKVTCNGDYKSLSDNYKIADGSWKFDAGIKAGCEAKGIDADAVRAIIVDFRKAYDEGGLDWMKDVSAFGDKTAFSGADFFKDADDIEIFNWSRSRVTTDLSDTVYTFHRAGYDVLCGYSDPYEAFVKWAELCKEELENPIVEY